MNKKSGFTLIELIIATTMLSIIMLSVFMIYFNIVDANKKLELTRILQENSRNITENIAKDIRDKGINYEYYEDVGQNISYSGGNSFLAINGGDTYCLINKTTKSCSCAEKKECEFGKYNINGNEIISDDRVIINKLNFFISGTNHDITNKGREGKVTVVFELGIMPGKGLNNDLIKNTRLNIETTISEKIYKK